MGPMTTDKDWQAQMDSDTLARAEEIKSNSERHGAAKSHAALKIKQLRAVAGAPTAPEGADAQLAKGYRKV